MSNFKKWIYRFIIVCVLLSCSTQKKKTTIQIPPGLVGLVGYGSLMSRQSMESTLQRAYNDSAYLINLQGFQREWNLHLSLKDTRLPESYSNRDWFYISANDTISFNNVIALNIMLSENSRMNCVLYFITQNELAGFDEREFAYDRIDVTNKIKEFDFKGGKVYAYKAKPEQIYRPQIDSDNSKINQSYVDLVINACDSIGGEFRNEYEKSTKPYNPTLAASVIWKNVR